MQTNLGKNDPDIAKAIKSLSDFFGNDKDLLINTYGTNLACSKGLGDFILNNFEVKDLPRNITYFLSLTWNLYAQVFCPEKKRGILFDMDKQNQFENKTLDERFAIVVKQMYDLCKELKLL